MSKPEWNSFDDLKAETLELHARIDAMAFRLVEMTDERNRARDALQNFVLQVDEFNCGGWDEADWPAAFGALVELAEVGRAALRETEGNP